ncbi:ATP/GTP-binding protein [Campylobacter sp. MIT 12-8780]|uniref:ATP-binding protein n=1 Tax=unclassified Campylobacter TaxID=2593542 RepID=UPI00115DD2DD|nr:MULTISPECIES: ATP-binding protein [unclassified Campylobacter]NDJ26980.1 ATP-binding protein [Campylobacter sp. MIT 19-121]TQR41879.1 ATP/GTP-binding protein [Campylobacter sp. MIT 12-8780]
MRISKVKIKNFRSYKDEIEIEFGNLTALVGKNDFGKSTILEALDIFLNENSGVVKLDKDDINKQALAENENANIRITIVFDDLPSEIIIDSTNPTTLSDEYLLNNDGKLEIIKEYKFGSKATESVFIKAYHPTNERCNNLLITKITSLKKILEDEEIKCEDKTKSATIRKAVWEHFKDDLQCEEVEIDASKEEAKNIWEQLKKYMPSYSLFQSDRKNSDGDNEIQNPMKLAVSEIFKDEEIQKTLDKVAEKVRESLQEVTKNTIDKLKEMNPEIADSLNPNIPETSSLKWVDVFKNVSITGDEDIPINKRGSGVKRLILLNFFRAEAERKRNMAKAPNIIYAIEEPETSQHFNYQYMLINALLELSKTDKTQVILTTHSPSIVKMLDFDNIRLLKDNGSFKEVVKIEKQSMPIPSLYEIIFLAFGEAYEEYHNELYGYIEAEKKFDEYKKDRDIREYIRVTKKGETKSEDIILTEYIRHQIHHPENKHNDRFTKEELKQSIKDMRDFIETNIKQSQDN